VTWVDLTSERLKENMRFPRELAACTTLPAMLHAYSNYCEAAIRQYHSSLSAFQHIALQLTRDVSGASFMPERASVDIQEQSAHDPERAMGAALR
jgi:hypothetical protein